MNTEARPEKVVGAGLFHPALYVAALLVLYAVTAQPALGWRDAPEFAVTSHVLGIAHPAGFPTFSLAGKLMTFLPLGAIPFRITLVSALFAALSVYLLALLVIRSSPPGDPDEEDSRARVFAGALTALAFGLSGPLWINATEIEVYSLNLFFIAATLFCGVRWVRGDGDAWLYAGGFLYGLAAGNHGTVAFYVPGFLAYIIGHPRGRSARRLAGLIAFFLIGCSVYLYLPIRGAMEPTFNFGDPDTWERFLAHVTNEKGAYDNFSGLRQGLRFFDHLWIFLSRTAPQAYWPLGLPLAVLGVGSLWRTDRPMIPAVLLIMAANVVFFVRWTNPTAFLPTFFLAVYLSGVGLGWLLTRTGLFVGDSGRSAVRIGAAALIGVFVFGAAAGAVRHDQSSAYLSLESFRSDYEDMRPDAISVVGVMWFHERAYQDIYRLREDLAVLCTSDFIAPQWFNPVTPDRFPRIAVPPDPYNEAVRGGYLRRFLRANLDEGRYIYWEPFDLKGGCFYPNLIPALDLHLRFTWQPIESLPSSEVQNILARLRSKLEREIEADGFLDEKEMHAYYMNLLMQYASYLQHHNHHSAGITVLQFLLDLFGPEGTDRLSARDRARLKVNIGVNLLAMNRLQEAIVHFAEGAALDPHDYKAWGNLGAAYIEADKPQKARESLERAVELAPRAAETYYNLGELYRNLGDTDQALSNYRRSLELVESPAGERQIREAIESLESGAEEDS